MAHGPWPKAHDHPTLKQRIGWVRFENAFPSSYFPLANTSRSDFYEIMSYSFFRNLYIFYPCFFELSHWCALSCILMREQKTALSGLGMLGDPVLGTLPNQISTARLATSKVLAKFFRLILVAIYGVRLQPGCQVWGAQGRSRPLPSSLLLCDQDVHHQPHIVSYNNR
ncbi:hypothetical protein BS50DRAFT_75097 [Corynespora cassiicola Philippines]|uniref:Uncharacterized protein n=1 Tax=Corynespora cassiicola Philippines TaxID=1448308 RepID=A0A2T2NGC4_CORCC|nr:hypothetical protein BS50DRAFT_75097 [Corynespora cassiicola Philippines]